MRKIILPRIVIVLLTTLVTFHFLSQEGSAETIFVDADTAPGGSGESWADAYKYLTDAIAQAGTQDEIWVAEGIYRPDQSELFPVGTGDPHATFQLKVLYGGFAGIENSRDQRDWRRFRSVLTGELSGGGHAYHVVSGGGIGNILNGFTITGGDASGTIDSDMYGGGIKTTNALVKNCRITGNIAKKGGAGYYGYGDLISCILEDNDYKELETECKGGGIHYTQMGGNVYNCLIRNNSATIGGGAYCSGPMIFINSTFTGNYASRNGNDGNALYLDWLETGDNNTYLKNSIFWDNGTQDEIYIRVGDYAAVFLHIDYCDQDISKINHVGNFTLSDGTGNINQDPLFVNGQRLSTDPASLSPCIDAGSDSAVPADLVLDLDGRNRFFDFTNAGDKPGNMVDMGAYEANGVIYVDEDASGENNGASWTDAFRYLQVGLLAAESGNEIWVAEGNYKPTYGITQPGDTVEMKREYTFALKSGLGIYGGFNGTEKQRSERNWLTNETILSGDINMKYETDNSYNVVTAIADQTAILDGFSIRGGYADDSSYKFSRGAGIHGGNASIVNCKIQSNYAIKGGGMYGRMSSNGNLFNCRFFSNHADTGGAFFAEINSSYQLTNCSFLDNTADLGGAVYMNSGGNHAFTNCTWSRNNAASLGGGIYSDSASATVYNSILWDNIAAVDGHELALVDCHLDIFRTALPDGPHDLYKDNGYYNGSYIVQSDPRFADTQGRLSPGSPCIDSGDNRAVPFDITDIDNDGDTAERLPIDLDALDRFVDDPATVDKGISDPPDYPQMVDMGAYERQLPLETCEADIDNDTDVDAGDLAMFCANYGRTICSNCPGDFTGDGDVDGADFHTMAWDYGKTDCAEP